MREVQQPANTTAAMEGLLRQGICTRAAQLRLDEQPEAGGHVRDELLAQVYGRPEECLSPATEWQAVRDVLGDDALLAALLGIGLASVHRYAKGERHCSVTVAPRLHWLALLIGQLEGTYNAYGIRRWFQRPRAALDEQSPENRLRGDWDPDGEDINSLVAVAQRVSPWRMAF